jgi:hypothetical protein
MLWFPVVRREPPVEFVLVLEVGVAELVMDVMWLF